MTRYDEDKPKRRPPFQPVEMNLVPDDFIEHDTGLVVPIKVTEVCGTCHWWFNGRCHVNAPTVEVNAFPATHENDFCSYWKESER